MSAQFEDGKDEGALRTIGEVSKALGIKTHVLRYWEQQFPMLEPLKRSGGRRYYRSEDVELIETIDRLVNHEGYTLKGAKKAIRDAATGQSKAADGAQPGDEPGTEISGIADAVSSDHASVDPASSDFARSDYSEAGSDGSDGAIADMESGIVTSAPPFMTSGDSPIAVDGGVGDFFGQPAVSETEEGTALPHEPNEPLQA